MRRVKKFLGYLGLIDYCPKHEVYKTPTKHAQDIYVCEKCEREKIEDL